MTSMKESGIDWIGQIPEEWEVAKVNHIFEEHKQKNRGNKEKNLLSLSYGRIIRKSIDSSFGLLPESFDTYNIIQRGDIVLRLTDLQNDKRSLRVGLARENGIITSAYLTLRLKNLESNDSYMYYLLHTYDICKVFYNFGGGVRQGGTWSDIYKMELLIPPCNEQQKIADFLDKKTSQLDKVKAILEEQIQKLKDYRASLIYETVTKGLDKNVPMKDSGIDWIGQLPQGWEVDFANHIFEEHKQKNKGNKEKNLLSLSYGRIIRKSIDSSFGLLPESFDTYNIIQRGDIVLRLTDLQNDKKSLRVGLARENGIITSAYLTLRLKSIGCSDSYMYYLLHTYDICKVFYNFGGGVRQGGTWSDIYKLELLIPPYNEQTKITDFLDKKTVQIDKLIKIKYKQIDNINKQRQTLIYDYVTGKRRV
ncbi:restriction endonuclease subunit S [Streptococcus salivarius]